MRLGNAWHGRAKGRQLGSGEEAEEQGRHTYARFSQFDEKEVDLVCFRGINVSGHASLALMLNLLPIRLFLSSFAVLVGSAVLAAVYGGWLGGDALRDASGVVRWSSTLALAVIVLFYAAWRWIPALQFLIFPYLGGQWAGTVRFQGSNGPDHRHVSLEIKHTPLGLRLLLDSDESTSRTLVVQADRDPDFDRFRIYYVYLNERKEGRPGGGQRYRGLAILRVTCSPQPELEGDYFTETHRRGTLHLTRSSETPIWKIWQ